ncbi:MAG TPA: hypothetical protein VEI01_11250 [Terriglobales bacterium]|nr:hypothetical protein [Terriglobales bacterium]
MSSTVLSAPRHALEEERHFALVDGSRFSNPGSLGIVRVRNSARPSHLFDHDRNHDYFCELPVVGSGMPNHYVGDLLLTIGMSGLSRVRTELSNWS